MILIILTLICLAIAICLLRKAIRDADESPEITAMYDEYYFKSLDEYSPDAVLGERVDKLLKIMNLRNKIKKL
jgi:predicted component of type VI protein secretion system